MDDAEQGASYLPLMGSLRPDTDVPTSDHLVCEEVIALPPFLQSVDVASHDICATLHLLWLRCYEGLMCAAIWQYTDSTFVHSRKWRQNQ